MSAMINVQNLNFSYGTGELQQKVLKQVNLQIGEGEIVIMTGPSGSGKTTLLTIIGGLRHAEHGSVSVLNKQLVESKEQTKVQVRQQTGYIFQQHNLLKSLSAVQNVSMALELHPGFNEKERLQRSKEMLIAVGLGDRIHHKPDQLSGGQRQRVSIARALVGGPKIVLADEPTASLDKQSGHEAVNILKRLAQDTGTTILLVTHDYRILDVADRIVELEDGIIKT
ncbi:MAG: ATP-binding cassette domain-containing protein [Methylococcaceae bacterium]|jgi:putative ABC transport system ATP-binding protein|nr:ATP-binding cassette domain-containing protein [Methylococcaceae bacterium]MDZ4157198.1 ATP-binding cassette domain-containing protein [Methylococcales bacterium]MDP2392487.1 ATP-binding cassette domain-containing protein [Methylococcaceae bacterium]MDP3020988.1 ATP-binding cassette domain-containing protein [Methylococcaceae bacterium]MDP3388375.1 ATP-binding cassette domain-containing protein [Methylococcaceae bacterium]